MSMSNKPLTDQYKKTDILKDWMNRDMASSPSACCSTTSSDNNQRQQSSLSSLESFLFLPQLPVDGDDEDEDALLFRNHNHHHRHHHHHLKQPEKRPLTSSLTILKSTESSSPHNNRSRSNQNSSDKRSCRQCQAVTSIHPHTRKLVTATRGDDDSHVCGKSGFPTNSLFPFIAVNDTVIASSNSNNDADSEVSKSSVKHSSSMSIFIKNSSSVAGNSGHNHSPFYLAANHHHRHHPLVHQPPHHHHYSRRRLLIFRICQAFSVLVCVLLVINLVKNCLLTNNEYKNRFSSNPTSSSSSLGLPSIQNRLIQSWNMPSILSPSSSSKFLLPEIASNSTSNDSSVHNLLLLNVPNFRFLMNNKTKCNIARDEDNYIGDGSTNDGGASSIFFMVIVHSAPQNFAERQAIRRSWGSLQRLGQFHIRLVFLLGHQIASADEKSSDSNAKHFDANESDYDANNTFYLRIQRESEEYGDIVAGNFHDSYRNLTYKHLMGYLWVLNHCSHAKYILKADDDAFIDIFQLFEFILRTFGPDPEAALICNVFPEGTKPVRKTDLQGKKWAVTYEEYPYQAYPKYCGGLAYLATPNVIHEIYRTSHSMRNKFLWIDDVYVTGILRELAHVEPFYLNLRYSYDPEEYRKWLLAPVPAAKSDEDDEENDNIVTYENKSHGKGAGVAVLSNRMRNGRRPTPPQKIPFMIVHLERGPVLVKEMRELWNKTVSVWSGSGLII